jgi:hypothetical protein
LRPEEYNSEILAFIFTHEQDHPAHLVLQAKQYPHIPIKEVAAQIAARQKAKSKLPEWYACRSVLFPSQLSMEQCSSELTARYKASLVSGDRMADLTAGTGIDTYYLAQNFKEAHFIEQQAQLCELAKHNFEQLGAKNLNVHHTTAQQFLQARSQPFDLLYLDPARRSNSGGKVFMLQDCEPDLPLLWPVLLQHAKAILVKLSPLIDLHHLVTALQLSAFELHIVSVANELKEVLLHWTSDMKAQRIVCADWSNHKANWSTYLFDFQEERTKQAAQALPLEYLYEPNAAVMKAGAFNSIAATFGVFKLHVHSHLYTSSEQIPFFPGRTFRVKHLIKPQQKELAAVLPAMQANLSIRNFPASVAELKKKLKIKDGGDEYVFGTTLSDGRKVLIVCEKL